MSASFPNPGERVRDVHLTEDTLAVDLADGRTIIVPLAWYPRLFNATSEQRSRWKVSGAGYGIPLAGDRLRLEYRRSASRGSCCG